MLGSGFDILVWGGWIGEGWVCGESIVWSGQNSVRAWRENDVENRRERWGYTL